LSIFSFDPSELIQKFFRQLSEFPKDFNFFLAENVTQNSKILLTQKQKVTKNFKENYMIEKPLSNLETMSPAQKSVRTKNQAFCILCAKQVELVGIQDAASRLQKTPETIFKLAEYRRIHRVYNHQAAIMICSDSLLGQIKTQ
jgi:hypothetical protein